MRPACREQREGSPWRDRPQAESLKLFEDMRRGLVAEGKATLRCGCMPVSANTLCPLPLKCVWELLMTGSCRNACRATAVLQSSML